MNRPSVRALVIIFVILILIAGAATGFIWWKISGLKETLVTELEKKIGAKVQVSTLDLDFWKGELHAAGITLTNDRPSAPWDTGAISQATVRFHLRDLIVAEKLPVSVDVASWSLVLHPGKDETTTTSSSSTSSLAEASNSSPESTGASHLLHVTELSAHEGSVEIDLSDNKKVMIQGVAFEANDNETGSWTTTLQATSVTTGAFEAQSCSVQIRSEADKLVFSNLRMSCGQGLISGDGERALSGNHTTHVTLKCADVPLTTLIAEVWQMKVSGLVEGTLDYQGNDQTGSAKGQIAVNQAKFNLLPGMAQVTALVGLPDITDLEMDKMTTDYTWQDRALHLTNIDVRKNDVTRIAGKVDVDPTEQVDGRIKLGLPSAITSKFPPIQDKIFSTKQDNYNWADVHVTGTPDHLQEDLTSRLLAVGLQEGLQQGNGLIDEAKQKATDLLKSFMGN